ncbi:hypothetical protein H0H87_006551 [Tephrocybe sp. NHM501043]|nr:hypothetical protein H0H87_006551 [Tephrocybe sp. NHM501043]
MGELSEALLHFSRELVTRKAAEQRLRQPRVISEVIGGIFLGPTVMGRIPGFKNAIFPDASISGLTLTSTIGLIVFLFLIGLEIDTKIVKRHLVGASAISFAGLAVPLGLGAALGIPIYKEFINPDVNYGYFLLFTAVAVGITAFPVLCRILTELKLLETTVGSVTLAAGVGNDVVGWILLALTVALVNASSGLTALYVLLASAGFIIFLLYPGKWAYRWLAIWTGSLERGAPTAGMMTLTLVIVFASAFFTDIIGVHAIFGGFLAGLIIPHDNGYAISLVEKLEDLVNIIFLPIYFTLSGLKTNLGLMDTGKTWGYTLTFMTTPLTLFFYPPKYRTRDAKPDHSVEGGTITHPNSSEETKTRFALVLDRIEQLPAAMTIAHLLHPSSASSTSSSIDTADKSESSLEKPPVYAGSPSISSRISINALRLIELTSRTSAVLKSKAAESLVFSDPVVSVFRTFGQLNNFLVSAALSVVNHDDFPSAVAKHVSETESQMVIIPWSRGSTEIDDETDSGAHNPFDGVFHKTNAISRDQTSSVVYSEFIRNIFSTSPSNVALFVDRGITTSHAESTAHHLLLPFIGGPDDRLALSFVVQLARNPLVQATVVRIQKTDDLSRESTNTEKKEAVDSASHIPVVLQTLAAADTVYAHGDTQTRLISETADNVAWDRYASTSVSHDAETTAALTRISFTVLSTSTPLHAVAEFATKLSQANNVIVVAGRSRRMAVEAHKTELQKVITEAGVSLASSVSKTLGDVGAALVASNTRASLLVLQATNDA